MKRQKTIKKIQEIQHLFAIGKTKQEVAKALGYTEISSLYRYANRNNLKWNHEIGNYIADEEAVNIEAIKNHRHSPTGKADNIIRMLKRAWMGERLQRYSGLRI